MKEKELRQYCKDASLEISNMQHTIDNLQQENQQLKDRINKAIKKLSNIELTQYELLNLYKDGIAMIKKEDVNKIIKSIKILKVDNKEE